MAVMPVVVGTDSSEESLRAVEWAAMEAGRHGAPLRIVSAPPVPPRTWAYDPAPNGVARVLGNVPRRALGEAITRCRDVRQDLLVDADLLTGPPALAVTNAGSGALMLVVGARGGGGFAAMLLGSVSRYVAMHGSCPVVVVRAETSAVHPEIAVGIRDLHDTAAMLPFVFEEAALRGATVVAVHAWHWFPSEGDPGIREVAERLADRAKVAQDANRDLTEILREWQEKYPDVPVRQEVVHGHPARVLASYTARSDLVVIGRHDGHDMGPAVGAVQHALLNHAHGPVAIIPARN